MASLLSPRRTNPELSLRATSASSDPSATDGRTPPAPPLGWPIAAIAGGLVTAVASWILCAGLAVVGWLAADPGTLGQALSIGTRLWLLSNGVSAPIGSIAVTLVPWGATAVTAFMLSRFAAFSARQVRDDQLTGPTVISVVLTAAYLVPVLVVAVWRGQPWQEPLHWAAVIAVLALSAAWGSSRALDQGLTESWPAWSRTLPRAILAAQLVLLAAGSGLLVTSLLMHLNQVIRLHQSLDPPVAGSIALLLAQLAVAPNAIVWAASYALGSGFVLGSGSVVAPAGTGLGILPGVPLFGALPSAGPGSPAELWWLAAGGLAGAVAAWVVLRTGGVRRFDTSSLIGGLAGLLGGAMFVGLAWAASGDLGTVRLAGLGPRLLPLLVMSLTTMGLAGLITGLVLGLISGRRRKRRRSVG
jgi:hypothetical protein